MNNIKPLISKERIAKEVKRIASEIKRDYGSEIICIVVLNGAMVFFVDLMREMKSLGMNVDYYTIKLSSYENSESTGKIKVDLEINANLKNKSVVIIEDIVDTGYTIKFLNEYLSKKGVKDVKVASMFDKKEKRKVDVIIDYKGIDAPDKFIVGYGLDYNQKYRDLDFIGEIKL